MHREQSNFCRSVRALYPSHFYRTRVLDVGSLDINGNNRYLFEDCDYTGVDVGPGPNVHIVMPVHHIPDHDPARENWYDVVISTEMLEHDQYWPKSLGAMLRMCRKGGLLILTCATTGRPEHGTYATCHVDSPFTAGYYKNLTEDDLRKVLLPDFFQEWNYHFITNEVSHDLYFCGIKA